MFDTPGAGIEVFEKAVLHLRRGITRGSPILRGRALVFCPVVLMSQTLSRTSVPSTSATSAMKPPTFAPAPPVTWPVANDSMIVMPMACQPMNAATLAFAPLPLTDPVA